jgi:histidyl-tRNA synthetase
MKYATLRGMKDILPSEIHLWQEIEKIFRNIFKLYNYKEIRTPIIEQTELFTRSLGTSTDIVSKEMYSFLDKKGRNISLRPEETAPVVRACLQNNLIEKDKITKLYYFGPMFRYDRPQAGRYRQFHQAGIEVFGSDDPTVDVETIALSLHLFQDLNLKDLETQINSVGCPSCQKEYLKELQKVVKEKKSSLCKDCLRRLEYNPLRIFDCKNKNCNKILLEAPPTTDNLCLPCKVHFEEVKKLLDVYKIKYSINDRLVRGLDYYTKTTYEIVCKSLGAQNAICGGGRYNNLVADLGGEDIPACGFAIGLERLIWVINEQKAFPKGPPKVDLYVAALGKEAKENAFKLIKEIRLAGLSADMDYLEKSLKAKLKAADRSGARYVAIIGEDEIKKGIIILKDMTHGTQKEVKSSAEIISVLTTKD